MSTRFLAAAIFLALAAPCQADPKDDTPEAAARRYVAALKKDNYEGLAETMDPDALKKFRRLMTEIVKAAEEDGKEGQILALLGVRTVGQMDKLDDAGFFLGFMRGVVKAAPAIKEALVLSDGEMLGHVAEGKDTAHVVCRLKYRAEDTATTKMIVISLRRTGDGWRVLLSGEFDGIVQSLKQRFRKQQ